MADHVGAAVRGRDDDDRDRRPAAAQLGEQLEAVGVAEAKVEQDEVEVVGLGKGLTGRARAADADHRDIAAEALDHVLQGAEDQGVIVDQQDFHDRTFLAGQTKRRDSDSATQTGLSEPSRSIVTSIVTWAPPSSGS